MDRKYVIDRENPRYARINVLFYTFRLDLLMKGVHSLADARKTCLQLILPIYSLVRYALS